MAKGEFGKVTVEREYTKRSPTLYTLVVKDAKGKVLKKSDRQMDISVWLSKHGYKGIHHYLKKNEGEDGNTMKEIIEKKLEEKRKVGPDDYSKPDPKEAKRLIKFMDKIDEVGRWADEKYSRFKKNKNLFDMPDGDGEMVADLFQKITDTTDELLTTLEFQKMVLQGRDPQTGRKM